MEIDVALIIHTYHSLSLPKDIMMQAQKLRPQIFSCDSKERAERRQVLTVVRLCCLKLSLK